MITSNLVPRTKYFSNFAQVIYRHLSVFSHGNGLYGGLGQGHHEVVPCPTLIDSLENKNIVNVATGWAHSAALTTDGEVYVWGQPYELLKVQRLYRQEMRYGLKWAKRWNNFASSFSLHGGPSGYIHPIQMTGLPSHEKVVQVECGVALTAVRCESGAVYMFGMNDFGQCGIGTDISKTNIKERTVYNPSRLVGGLDPLPSDFDFDQFSDSVCDDNTKKGTSKGDDLVDDMLKQLILQTPPWKGQEVVDVSLGYSHGAAITVAGGLLTWGKGLRGQLGQGRDIDIPSPQRCTLEQDLGPKYDGTDRGRSFSQPEGSPTPATVSCGATHTACLTTNGDVYVWGKFQSSEVKPDEYEGPIREMMKKSREGKPIYQDQLRPRKVELPHKAIQIACSAYHTAILLETGDVYAMGLMIGSGDIIPQPIPFTVVVERKNDLGVGWDETYEERISVAESLAEKGDDSVALIKGGSSANCTAFVTSKGDCFTLFFCEDESELLDDSNICTLQETWTAPDASQKVVDVSIGWHHALLVTK